MTKITIFSGFLGAGKTTLIKKLIKEAYVGEKLVLIENEFGEIGIDSGFLSDAGINITEMNSGCICCSLVGDFSEALQKVQKEFAPDRILIEPSGVGKLSDVVGAVESAANGDMVLEGLVTVADAKKCRMHMRNFGEFFNNQIEHARTIVLSHTKDMDEQKLSDTVAALRSHNEGAVIVTTDWDQLTGAQLLAAITDADTLEADLAALKAEEACPVCGHIHHEHEHHEHHHHDGECCHHDHEHHEHHHHEGECCHHDHEHHEHHHHDGECCHHDHEHHEHHHHDGECCHHDHEHHEHHHHDGECCCHEHHGHDHHHHHADEVFVSYGAETANRFDKQALESALAALTDEQTYGTVLRAKGIVACTCGHWLHFDYVPGEPDVREGAPAIIGRLCIIGANLNKEALSALFNVTLN
ncbi:MAG: cobalamin biosynthesis protein CobW [Ruminococcaceae bacterium]|nr:cobalamin biosynthesis protein CobW [Oscillospiraceae bacterium]